MTHDVVGRGDQGNKLRELCSEFTDVIADTEEKVCFGFLDESRPTGLSWTVIAGKRHRTYKISPWILSRSRGTIAVVMIG